MTGPGRPAEFPPGQGLPKLQIVETAAVHLHEDADGRRVGALVERLAADAMLRNPPVAAPLPAGGFVVLDGANRTTALRRMEVPALLLQVVEYGSPQIRLEVWHHLLREDGAALEGLLPPRSLVDLEDGDDLNHALAAGEVACGVIAGERVRGVRSEAGFPNIVAALRRTVAGYSGRLPIYRVLTDDLDELRQEFDRIGALVVFPRFRKEQILALAALDDKLPTGITRHVIPNRALRVNLPLEMLRGAGSIEAKNEALAAMIHERLLAHRVRVYREPTVLFDD